MRRKTNDSLAPLMALGRAFTNSDAKSHGIHPSTLARMTQGERPVLDRIAHGIYLPKGTVCDGRSFAAEAALRFPDAVLCLRTAAQLHGLTTEVRNDNHLAMSTGFRPRPASLGNDDFGLHEVTWVRWNERSMTVGVETMEIHGIQVTLTSPMRTVVDYFRKQGGHYGRVNGIFDRNEVIDVLDRYLDGRDSDNELMKMAEAFGVRHDVEPILEGRRVVTRRF